MQIIEQSAERIKAYFHGSDVVQTKFTNHIFLQGLEDASNGAPYNPRYEYHSSIFVQCTYEFGRQYYFEYILPKLVR